MAVVHGAEHVFYNKSKWWGKNVENAYLVTTVLRWNYGKNGAYCRNLQF